MKFSFERYAAKDSTNKDKPFFASIESIDASDPDVVTLKFKAPSFEALFHLGYNTAVIIDEKSAANEATQPVGTGPYKLAAWNKGSSATLDAWDGYRDAGKIAIKHATSIHRRPSAETAACSPATSTLSLASCDNARPVQERSALPGAVGGTEGKTILGINNKKQPLDELKVRQAIAYAIDRKAIIDGAHERPRHADRQPSDAERSGLCRSHRPISARSRQGEGVAEGGRRQDAAQSHADRCRRRLMRARAARSSPPNSPRSASRPRSRTSNGRNGSSNVYKNKNYDLTIISHVEPLDIGIYANPNYYFQYDNKDFHAIIARLDRGAGSRRLQEGARRRATQARRRLRQRVPVPAAEYRRRRRAPVRPVEERADLRQRSLRDIVEIRSALSVKLHELKRDGADCWTAYRRGASFRPSKSCAT